MENENNEVLENTDEMEDFSPSVPSQDEISGSDPPVESEPGPGSGESGSDLQEGDGQLLDENGEPLEGEGLPEAPAGVTAEELKEIVYGSIEEYFSVQVINVSVQEKGIDAPLADLGLRDALLFVLVLVALGHAVSEIIGGKLKWRK